MPILGSATRSDHSDPAVPVPGIQDNRADKVGIQGELEVVGQRVVLVVLEMVEDEDVAGGGWQLLLTLDDIPHQTEGVTEPACTDLPHVTCGYLGWRGDHVVLHAPERLEEFVLSSDLPQDVDAQLREAPLKRVDALHHLLETRECITAGVRAPQ